MEKVELKIILREAFGDSSSESDGANSSDDLVMLPLTDYDGGTEAISIFGDAGSWESVDGINGLRICRDFLSADQQNSALSALEKEGYYSAQGSHNQAMRFGDLPSWAVDLSYYIRESIATSEGTCPFPPELLWREPLFNQLIVNIYQPGEGICAHVDLMKFDDGIAIVSLESTCVMHFSPVEAKDSSVPLPEIPVLLTQGSLVLMWGEARYEWKHEINRTAEIQRWDGKQIDQKRRTSVTLRRLRLTE